VIGRAAIAAALAVAVVSGAWAMGHRAGAQAEAARWRAAQDKLQAQLFDLADRHSAAAAELLRLRADQETALGEFEDAARADPAAAGRRPAADSLRRLEALWGRARAAP